MVSDDRGSTPVEFVLVGVLLTVLTLGVLQLGLAVYVRNVVHDAAVEGAYHGALADVTTDAGASLARQIVEQAVGDGFVEAVTARESSALGHPTVDVTVVTRLPLVGLLGVPGGWEVTARAPAESFE
ncbi:TadE/TadG family type IV pilus assembly protein [Microbacterium sp. 179-B 1A2 NHS]|uniref:TadE/TadG family type IV pilus assembly protein n=1 Tax=Microbacterium sp. 179-B 1A2 NHS TaxID=3142383 RepID=UPI0039A2653D